jgi:hypothetical protein
MKNIHVLPTDKEKRLHDTFGNLRLEKGYDSSPCSVNIYITSDEDIDENDYIITQDGRLVQVSYLLSKDLEGALKVILTTDQDLINDDVTGIDDEFLEWFIKNPSCEFVEVQKGFADGSNYGYNFLDYEIIIPKEEQTKCYCGHTSYCDCGPEEPKEETIEVSDKERLDWIQKIMTKGDNYCEVFFAGLRNGLNDAIEFQIECNPEKFKVIKCNSVRECIDKAIKNYETRNN